MQLEILSFCDAATDHGGKLNIIGATDTILAPAFPLKYPHCAIVSRFRVSRIEEGEHTVKLMLIDMDGNSVMSVDGKMNIKLLTGVTGAVNLIVNFSNLELKEVGEYAIEVAVDGLQMGSTPLYVKQQPGPEAGNGSR